MRMGLFVLVSLTLHATALSYPVFFLNSPGAELIPVVVLSSEGGNEGGRAGDERPQGSRGRPSELKYLAVPRPLEQVGEAEKPQTPENPISAAVSLVGSSEGVAVTSADSDGTGVLGFFSMQPGTEDGIGGSDGQGNSGIGIGSGSGRGDGGGGPAFAQVSYAYNPKPEYPEKARREGKEGTVLLRVLVDEEGNSKSIEVNRSSGVKALDYAAMGTVRRWRFEPARYGEKRVESWVRIPIVFRLAGARD